MEKLVEKVTCVKCDTTLKREVEVIGFKDDTNTLKNKLTALVIKKFECSECGASDSRRELTKNSESIA